MCTRVVWLTASSGNAIHFHELVVSDEEYADLFSPAMPHLRYMYDYVHSHVQYSMHSSICTYCHDVVCSLVIWSLYFSSATCRFVVLSLASNTVKTHVFSMEFGLGVLASWNDIMNEEPPLSPPTFTHTSSLGIMPSCQVSRWTLDWKVVYFYTYGYSLCAHDRWKTFM